MEDRGREENVNGNCRRKEGKKCDNCEKPIVKPITDLNAILLPPDENAATLE